MAPQKSFHLSLGDRGEMIGWAYLVRCGYKLLEKNYRCKIGELDVIAKKDGRLIFIEIKTRSSARFGAPEESVESRKQKKMIRLAKWYLKENKKMDVAISFAVLAITLQGYEEPAIRLIEDAFSVTKRPKHKRRQKDRGYLIGRDPKIPKDKQ